MSQVIKQWIGADQVDGSKILMLNNTALRFNDSSAAAKDILSITGSNNLILQGASDSGTLLIKSLDNNTTNSASISLVTGAAGGAGVSGNIYLTTGGGTGHGDIICSANVVRASATTHYLGSAALPWSGVMASKVDLYNAAAAAKTLYMDGADGSGYSTIGVAKETTHLVIKTANATTDVIPGYIELRAASATAAGTRDGGNIYLIPGNGCDTGLKGAILCSTSLISEVVDPVSAQDAATKNYVDTAIGGLVAGLIYKGALPGDSDMVTFMTPYTQGWFYKVSTDGTLTFSDTSTLAVNIGDMIIINKDVLGAAIVAGDVDKIDNTEAADIMRTSTNSTLASGIKITLNADVVSFNADDLVTKAYVTTMLPAANADKKETLTFTVGTLTYDLLNVAKADSISIFVQGGPIALEDSGGALDYSVALTGGAGGKTRITITAAFAAQLATTGVKMYVQYRY